MNVKAWLFKHGTLLAGLWVGMAPAAWAQSGWRSVAVPYYTPPAFVQGLQLGWYTPRARELVRATDSLTAATRAHCAGPAAQPATAAREAWRTALFSWDRLSTVSIGPLVERRSARRIDFVPARPELMARAIESAPESAADMERIGSPAKGFPALERLLWPSPATPGSPACAYAVQVAADIGREALALAEAFEAAGRTELDEAQTVSAMSEAVNQWLGGLDALRVQGFERPLLERKTRAAANARFARDTSGASAEERAQRWQALSALAVFEGPEAPAPATGLVPLEPYLRGKGLNPLADKLAAAVRLAERGVEAARGNQPARVQAAARPLAALRALVEAEVAPALDIRLGFSDADGD